MIQNGMGDVKTSEEARSVILETLDIDPAALEQRTGWQITPQGACKGNQCVPLTTMGTDRIDARSLAERLNMPPRARRAERALVPGPRSRRVGALGSPGA